MNIFCFCLVVNHFLFIIFIYFRICEQMRRNNSRLISVLLSLWPTVALQLIITANQIELATNYVFTLMPNIKERPNCGPYSIIITHVCAHMCRYFQLI